MPITADDRYLRPPNPRYEDLDAAARDYYRILNQILADEGLPPRYEVLQISIGDFALANAPGEPDVGTGALLYDKATTEVAFAGFLMPHSWEENSITRWRLLWDTPDANTGTVIWVLEYYFWGQGGAVIPAATTFTLTASAPGVQNELVATEFPSLTASGIAVSDFAFIGVKRTAGTYASDAQLRMVDLLHRRSTRGSQLERTKYAVDTTG